MANLSVQSESASLGVWNLLIMANLSITKGNCLTFEPINMIKNGKLIMFIWPSYHTTSHLNMLNTTNLILVH